MPAERVSGPDPAVPPATDPAVSPAADLGPPLRRVAGALVGRRIRLTDDPEIIERFLAGLLNLP